MITSRTSCPVWHAGKESWYPVGNNGRRSRMWSLSSTSKVFSIRSCPKHSKSCNSSVCLYIRGLWTQNRMAEAIRTCCVREAEAFLRTEHRGWSFFITSRSPSESHMLRTRRMGTEPLDGFRLKVSVGFLLSEANGKNMYHKPGATLFAGWKWRC